MDLLASPTVQPWWQLALSTPAFCALLASLITSLAALVGVLITLRRNNSAQDDREDKRWERDREDKELAYQRQRRARHDERRVLLYLDLMQWLQGAPWYSVSRSSANLTERDYDGAVNEIFQKYDGYKTQVLLLASRNIRESWFKLGTLMNCILEFEDWGFEFWTHGENSEFKHIEDLSTWKASVRGRIGMVVGTIEDQMRKSLIEFED